MSAANDNETSVFDDLRALHKAFSEHERVQDRYVKHPCKFDMSVAFMLEKALKDSKAPCDINPLNNGFTLHINPNSLASDYKYTYPEKAVTERINQMEKAFASGWSRQADGSWIKMTDEFCLHHLTQNMYSGAPQYIIEEATYADEKPKEKKIKGLCMPDDAAMNDFAKKVGFTSPVRQV